MINSVRRSSARNFELVNHTKSFFTLVLKARSLTGVEAVSV